MALRKTIELPSGYTADYMNIAAVQFNKIHRQCVVQLAVYKDEAARIAGKEPAVSDPIYLNGELVPFTAEGVTYTDIYAALKALPDFAGAEDC